MNNQQDLLLYNLHFCLRSLIMYIQKAKPPLECMGENRKMILAIETFDFKLSLKILEEARVALFNIKTMDRPELIQTTLDPSNDSRE